MKSVAPLFPAPFFSFTLLATTQHTAGNLETLPAFAQMVRANPPWDIDSIEMSVTAALVKVSQKLVAAQR